MVIFFSHILNISNSSWYEKGAHFYKLVRTKMLKTVFFDQCQIIGVINLKNWRISVHIWKFRLRKFHWAKSSYLLLRAVPPINNHVTHSFTAWKPLLNSKLTQLPFQRPLLFAHFPDNGLLSLHRSSSSNFSFISDTFHDLRAINIFAWY